MAKVYINDHLEALDLNEAFEQMSAQRRSYLQRFSNERAQRAGAAAYLLLCQGLRELFDIAEPPTFTFGIHGKPGIIGHEDIFFSLSHCREAACCAIATEPVGIDIESIRPFSPALLKRTMNAGEAATVRTANEPQRAFIRLWTQKEAYLKLTGTGLVDELHSVLDEAKASGCVFETTDSPDRRYVYSLCLKHRP
ncbi:MAG: 4'-phosphopantetheinyl transferase superfamily protein [Bacteroidaceae bacterium]|nr:4'-phosphopantetheinyl transferase superfamily protein [Bacteroidaceae bacterium]